jgi:hypothetical protein
MKDYCYLHPFRPTDPMTTDQPRFMPLLTIYIAFREISYTSNNRVARHWCGIVKWRDEIVNVDPLVERDMTKPNPILSQSIWRDHD